MKQYDAKEAKFSFLFTMLHVYMYIGNFAPSQYGYLCGANNDVNVYATSKSSLSVKKGYFRSTDML
jgi:hypothetical protein